MLRCVLGNEDTRGRGGIAVSDVEEAVMAGLFDVEGSVEFGKV